MVAWAKFKPHWFNTSSNGLVKELLQLHAFSAHEDTETLLAGGSIEKKVDENIAFSELKHSANVVWNLLLFAGYLKAVKMPRTSDAFPIMHRLSIPNLEIEQIYWTCEGYFQDRHEFAIVREFSTGRTRESK